MDVREIIIRCPECGSVTEEDANVVGDGPTVRAYCHTCDTTTEQEVL